MEAIKGGETSANTSTVSATADKNKFMGDNIYVPGKNTFQFAMGREGGVCLFQNLMLQLC